MKGIFLQYMQNHIKTVFLLKITRESFKFNNHFYRTPLSTNKLFFPEKMNREFINVVSLEIILGANRENI